MTTTARRPGRRTIADWLAQPEDARIELIDGEFAEKAAPVYEHGLAQFGLSDLLRPNYHRRGGSGRPGGWWIVGEVGIQLGANVFQPDLVGWRRERVPVMPKERPIALRPDWICEVLSESNASTDTVKKLRRYHQAGVPHYWLVDPVAQTLTVYRHAPEGWVNVVSAEKGETVRAEPFDAIELRVGLLFGEDPDDPPGPPPEG